jgi:hypothetical protein
MWTTDECKGGFSRFLQVAGNRSLCTIYRNCGGVSQRGERSLICNEDEGARTRNCGPCNPQPYPRGSRGGFQCRRGLSQLSLAKKIERAESKVRESEARYHTTPTQLETEAPPEDADYATHEDYAEWRYWSRIWKQTERR